MTDERRRQRAEQEADRPRRGGLLGVLRRVIAPRAPEVLVMERDGRLVSARAARPGDAERVSL